MLRKIRFSPGKHGHVLPWTIGLIGLIGLISLPVVVYGLYIAEVGSGGGVETVIRPSVEALEIPSQTTAAEGSQVEGSLEGSGRETGQNEPNVSCENLLLMVDSDHTLKAEYVPPDLVYLSTYGIPARGAEDMLRQEAAEQLGSLISAAAEDGVEVLAASGYRSYWEQQGTFAWFKNTYGGDADKLSAPPGRSEHQLGTAVDFASPEAGYELVSTFSETSAGIWVARHAAEYGFILSYRRNQKTDTGIGYEPWHYRFVGVEKALKIETSKERPTFFYLEGKPYCYGP